MACMTLIFYILASSSLFSYGIGFNLLLEAQYFPASRLFKTALKMAAVSFLASAILWFPFSRPALATALSGILLLFAAMLSFALLKALAVLLPDDFTNSRLEVFETLFVFSVVILSLKESVSFFDALLISISCSLSFALFLFLLMAAFCRVSPIRVPESRAGLAMTLVLLGLFSFIQPLFDVIWSSGAFGG